MDQILQGLEGVVSNMEDMLITGKYILKTSKIFFPIIKNLVSKQIWTSAPSFRTLIFCGIKISKKGFHKTKDKIEAVTNALAPNDKTQLCSFLGLVNFYHKWLQNIAHVEKTLYDLLQKNISFIWSGECDKAFNNN